MWYTLKNIIKLLIFRLKIDMITLITNSSPLAEIGTKTLSGYLIDRKIDCKVIYLNNIMGEYIDENIKTKILRIVRDSSIVGMSLMTKDFFLFKDLTAFLKKKTKAKIIWGGIHPTVKPDEAINFCDFVCVGEGEEPLYLLCQKLNSKKFTDVPNLVYKKGNKVIRNNVGFIVNNLNTLPLPDYEFKTSYILYDGKIIKIPQDLTLKKKLLGANLAFYSQRGCPYSCTYCTNYFLRDLYKTKGKLFYRRSSVERIIKELETYKKLMPFIESIVINDDEFLARSDEEIKEFSIAYKKVIGLPFYINALGSFVKKDKIKYLVDACLKGISIGIQTGSKRILKHIYYRPVFSETNIKASRIVNKYKNNLEVKYDLIVDNPYEHENDKIQTVKLLNRLSRPFDLQLHSLVFFPGTRMYDLAKRDGLIEDEESQIYRKRYQIDITNEYFNAIFFINSISLLPVWLNNFLINKNVRKSVFFSPFRFLMSRSIKFLLIIKALKIVIHSPSVLKHYIKYLTILPKPGYAVSKD